MTLRLFNTPLGKFNVLTNDVAFYECLSKGNSWDYHTIVKLLKNIPEEGNIIDVGGHIGTHAIPYSIHKNKSHIYTLEPQSYIRDILIKNMKENSITNMTILPYGAGHMNCNVKLANDFTSDGYDPNLTINYNSETNQNFGGLGITNDPLGEEIKLVTIDSLGIKDVSFIKIDVEGAEALVIYGAQETIKKYKPILHIEESDKSLTHIYSNDLPALKSFNVKDFLYSLGYVREELENCNYLYKLINKLEVSLDNNELTIFSESGEDGILNKLFKLFNETNKFYVEFGAEDGTQCNTRALREFNGFNGILFDMNYENLNINLFKHMITIDNVINLFKHHNVPKDMDLLSIDIDSIDFYVLEEILKHYVPRIIVCEYNATHLPTEDKIVLIDSKSFNGNYFGASILSFYKLGRKYNYSLVYANNKGVNLFFVNDLVLQQSNYRIKNTNNVEEIYKLPKYGNGPNGGHKEDIFKMKYTNTEEIWTTVRR